MSHLLFHALPPEIAHAVVLRGLKWLHRLGISHLLATQFDAPARCMNMTFANPVGLAAGVDKNAEYIDALGALGFGFIEVGTVTPQPQPGNPRPRLFRIPHQKAIINRMGFNNKGMLYMAHQLQKPRSYQGIVGVNIGKNATTPLEQAHTDYQQCITYLYPWCDYIAVNISSPNTAGLRTLQTRAYLYRLLSAVQETHQISAYQTKCYKPLVVKIAPDIEKRQMYEIADVVNRLGIDGLIVSNTTILRTGLKAAKHTNQVGGVSGAPLFKASTELLLKMRGILDDQVALIGVGGILSGADALAKVRAGATLVQVYTGFVYRHVALLRDLQKTFS